MQALHAEAATQLERLFPTRPPTSPFPNGNEEEPTSDADDDFEEPAPKGPRSKKARAEAERAEHIRAADAAVANGAPAQRPSRNAAVAANTAMDALHKCGELE